MQNRNTALAKRWREQIRKSRPACHICGQAIDWEADWLDPKSFVIDHVVPLAKGGADALSNIRAAHRRSVNATARSAHAWSPPSSGEAAHSSKTQREAPALLPTARGMTDL